MIFVDTNYFLRYLLKDQHKQSDQAKELLLNGAQGKVDLFTSLIVIFEIYWVLSSFYKREKKEICDVLQNILRMKFISLCERESMANAVQIFRNSNLDLEDAYNLVYARSKQATEFATFDKQLSKEFNNTT